MRIPTGVAGTPADQATAFIRSYAALFGVADVPESLEVVDARPSADGATTLVFLRQSVQGLPVFGAGMKLGVNADGDVHIVGGHVVPVGAAVIAIPTVASSAAEEAVGGEPGTAELGWYDPEAFGEPAGPLSLAWRLFAPHDGERHEVLIHARTAAVLHWRELSRKDRHQEIFYCGACSAESQRALKYDTYCHDPSWGDAWCQAPATCSGGHCQASWQGDAAAAYTNSYYVWSYYNTRHSRDGWDNNLCQSSNPRCNNQHLHAMRVIANDNLIPNVCNASWIDPPSAFVRLADGWVSHDTLAHEFTHGVFWIENIDYGSTALSKSIQEGVADAFGEWSEQAYYGTADWVQPSLRPSCLPSSVKRRNLANPRAPGYEQICTAGVGVAAPDNFADYRECDTTGLGGHFDATIPGKLAWLMSRNTGDAPVLHWGISVGGLGATTASKVFYSTLVTYLADGVPSYAKLWPALRDGCSYWTAGSDPDFQKCLAAIDSVGLWSIDYSTGSITTDSGVSYVSRGFPATQYLFYKRDANLYRSQYTCFPSCAWRSETLVASDAATGPAATNFQAVSYVFYADTSGNLRYGYIDGSGWHLVTPPLTTGVITTEPPTTAVSNNTLLVGFKLIDGIVRFMTYDPANGWRGPFSSGITVTSDRGPVFTSGDEDPYNPTPNLLYMVYGENTTDRIAYRTINYNGSGDPSVWTWNAQQYVGSNGQTPTTEGAPAARVFRGNLHVVAPWRKDISSPWQINYLTGTNPNGQWSWYATQENTSSRFAAGLTTNGQYLWLWHTPQGVGPQPISRRYKASQ